MRPQRADSTSGLWALGGPLLSFVLALVVRTLWIPLSRHRFDGHEAESLRAFQGQDVPSSTHLYPSIAALYRALGQLSQDPRLLLGLNLIVGSLLAAFGARIVARRAGPQAGLWAGLLLALSPTHAAWSASAYNVILPQALLMAGCALGGWAGAALYALACSGRVELAALAPAVWLVADRKVALGALGALVCWPLLQGAPEARPLGLVLPANLPMTAYLGPLGSWPGLVLVALALRREALPCLGAALITHGVSACFDDQGARHELFGAFALIAVLASAPGIRRVLLLGGLALSLVDLWTLRQQFYADVQSFVAQIPKDTPRLSAPPEGCLEVLDDPVDSRSHWNYRGGWGVPESWPRLEGGLRQDLCWGEEAIHRAWTSRALNDRAQRMRALYHPVLLGVWDKPGGPRLIWRLEP